MTPRRGSAASSSRPHQPSINEADRHTLNSPKSSNPAPSATAGDYRGYVPTVAISVTTRLSIGTGANAILQGACQSGFSLHINRLDSNTPASHSFYKTKKQWSETAVLSTVRKTDSLQALRRRMKPRPAIPMPSRAREAGSGTAVTLKVVVSVGASGAPPTAIGVAPIQASAPKLF